MSSLQGSWWGVAEAVGFDNAQYFSTAFKKHFGISPSKFW